MSVILDPILGIAISVAMVLLFSALAWICERVWNLFVAAFDRVKKLAKLYPLND